MTENERIVTDFCRVFGRMDADELIDYFSLSSDTPHNPRANANSRLL